MASGGSSAAVRGGLDELKSASDVAGNGGAESIDVCMFGGVRGDFERCGAGPKRF